MVQPPVRTKAGAVLTEKLGKVAPGIVCVLYPRPYNDHQRIGCYTDMHKLYNRVQDLSGNVTPTPQAYAAAVCTYLSTAVIQAGDSVSSNTPAAIRKVLAKIVAKTRHVFAVVEDESIDTEIAQLAADIYLLSTDDTVEVTASGIVSCAMVAQFVSVETRKAMQANKKLDAALRPLMEGAAMAKKTILTIESNYPPK